MKEKNTHNKRKKKKENKKTRKYINCIVIQRSYLSNHYFIVNIKKYYITFVSILTF